MAIVTRKISDLSGTEAGEDAFASVIIREHPKVQEAKRLDALPQELDQFKGITDLVVLEVRLPDGTNKELAVKHSDFAKVLADDKVLALPGTKGRIPGTRLNGS